MAYVSKQWKDRQVEYPNRRTITHDDLTQEVVSVNRNEGTIYEAGDVLDSVNMNNLESRIAAGFNEKQNTLTAGQGITIENDVISATGGGGGASALDDLTDVSIIAPTVGQALVFNGTGWENDDVSGGSSSLAELSDVVISSPSDKQGLVYDATTQKWKNGSSAGFALEKTASGAVVSFNDGADDLPVIDLTAQITAVQAGSGDPSPSNVRSISGFTGVNVTRAGKNLFDENTTFENKGLYYVADDILPNTVCNMSLVDRDTSVDMSGVYFGFISHDYSTGTLPSSEFRWVITNGSVQSIKINKSATDKLLTGLACYPQNQATLNKILARYYIQIEVGNTATAYEPYSGDTYSVTWQTEAGTVYGGYIDLTTGLLTVTHARVNLGDMSWTKNDNYPVFVCNYGGVNTEYNAYCEIYKYAGTVTSASGATSKGNETLSILTNDSRHLIYIRDDGYSDSVSFTSAVSGYYLVYELATPQTYQLTPKEIKTLLGNNTFFADTGNVSVDYQTEQASDIIDLVGEGGASDLADLGDVDLTTPTDGQVLTYDATSEKWVNEDAQGSPVVAEKTVFGSEPSATASTLTVTDAQGSACVKLTQKLIAAQIDKPHYVPSAQPPVEEFGLIQKVSNATVTHEHDGTTDTISVAFSTSVYGCEYDFVSGVRKITHDAMTITTCTMNNTLTSVFAKSIDSKYIQRSDAFIEASVYNLVPSRYYLTELKDHEIMLWYGNWNGTTRLWAVWRDDRFTVNSDMTTWLTSDANHAICLVGELQTPTYSTETANSITMASGTNTFTSAFSPYFYEKLELTYVSSSVQDIIDAVQAETGISDLNDTQILNPYNDQALLYDSTSGRWTNKAIPVPWVEVTGNLSVGSTSITLPDASITTDSTIDVYTDPELPHTAISVSTGSVTISFEAQQTIIAVKVRVS